MNNIEIVAIQANNMSELLDEVLLKEDKLNADIANELEHISQQCYCIARDLHEIKERWGL